METLITIKYDSEHDELISKFPDGSYTFTPGGERAKFVLGKIETFLMDK